MASDGRAPVQPGRDRLRVESRHHRAAGRRQVVRWRAAGRQNHTRRQRPVHGRRRSPEKGDVGTGSNEDEVVFIPLRTARSRVLGSLPQPVLESEMGLKTEKKTLREINYAHEASFQALDYLVIKYAPPASATVMKKVVEEE